MGVPVTCALHLCSGPVFLGPVFWTRVPRTCVPDQCSWDLCSGPVFLGPVF